MYIYQTIVHIEINCIQKYEEKKNTFLYEMAKTKLNCICTENTMMTNMTDTNERRSDSKFTRNKKRKHEKQKNKTKNESQNEK